MPLRDPPFLPEPPPIASTPFGGSGTIRSGTGRWCRLAVLLLLAPAPVFCGQRVLVPPPVAGPVWAPAGDAPLQRLEDRIAEHVRGLADGSFRERARHQQALHQLVREEGRRAWDILDGEAYTHHEDPEVAVSVREVLDATRALGLKPLPDNWPAIAPLVVKGLQAETLPAFQGGGMRTAGVMLHAHLRLELGVDILYSLWPEHVIPEAARLLELQKEDYYRVLLARTVEGTLSRAIKPVFETQGLQTSGMEYLRAHPDTAKLLAGLTGSPCDELRLTALRICASGLIPLPPEDFQRLLDDPNPDISDEARRLRCILAPEGEDPDRALYATWIKGCLAALAQEEDLMARLGAYNALSHLLDGNIGALHAALPAAQGVSRNALETLLSSDQVGRLLLIRDGRLRDIQRIPPESLGPILKALQYENGLLGPKDFSETELAAVAPLVRRNLLLHGRSDQTCFGRVGASETDWHAAVRLSMKDLAPTLEGMIQREPRYADRFNPILAALAVTNGEVFHLGEANAWYELCAGHLNVGPLDIRTGAVHALLASGRAGAEALLARHRKDAENDVVAAGYVKGLAVFHPYTHFVGGGSGGDAALAKELSAQSLVFAGNTRRAVIDGSGRDIYNGDAAHIPLALWAYANNNDCNCMNPLGHYLAHTLEDVHIPLMLAWLDYNPRMSIFLLEVDGRAARTAVLRRLDQRRTDWQYCYDHDLFHFVVAHEMPEAIPVLENYVKTNRTWPSQGLKTLAGIEADRYCWTPDVKRSAANPLVLPTCRELMARPDLDDRARGYGKGILDELKQPEAKAP